MRLDCIERDELTIETSGNSVSFWADCILKLFECFGAIVVGQYIPSDPGRDRKTIVAELCIPASIIRP